MRPIPVSTLLVATLLAAPLSAQITGGLRPAAAQRAGQVTVQAAHLQSLQGRLDGFAAQLPAEERALWDHLLLRAAHAPSPGRGAVRVTPVLEIGPGGGCEVGPGGGCEIGPGGGCAPGPDDGPNRVAVILQGGRMAGASGGIIAPGGGTRTGLNVQGSRPGVRPGDAPRPTPTGDGTVAIGPKQDDPAPPPQSLARRIAALAANSPAEERAALNWLLTRAATAPEGRPGTPGGLANTPNPEAHPGRPATVPAGAIPSGRIGTPGGLPPGPCNPESGCRVGGGSQSVSLRQALGIDALAIGPKQDDPAPPPPTQQRWILRF